jgi:hypothetical protein
MSDELQETISRIKPMANAVVEAASALNSAIAEAAAHELSVRIEVLEEERDDGDPVPVVRARISKRIA